MEDINEIRSEITRTARHGDYSTVGQMVGLKADTIRRIVRGTRQNDAVVRQFEKYLVLRSALEQQLSTEAAK